MPHRAPQRWAPRNGGTNCAALPGTCLVLQNLALLQLAEAEHLALHLTSSGRQAGTGAAAVEGGQPASSSRWGGCPGAQLQAAL